MELTVRVTGLLKTFADPIRNDKDLRDVDRFHDVYAYQYDSRRRPILETKKLYPHNTILTVADVGRDLFRIIDTDYWLHRSNIVVPHRYYNCTNQGLEGTSLRELVPGDCVDDDGIRRMLITRDPQTHKTWWFNTMTSRVDSEYADGFVHLI